MVTFTGYKRVLRLDRRVGRSDQGGIVLITKHGFFDNAVHIKDAPIDERSWYVIKCDFGPVMLCVWYRQRRPREIDSILRFKSEVDFYSRDTVATLAVGDFNVHNAEWLRFSDRNNPERHHVRTGMQRPWFEAACAITHKRQKSTGSGSLELHIGHPMQSHSWHSRRRS